MTRLVSLLSDLCVLGGYSSLLKLGSLPYRLLSPALVQ